MIKRFQKNSRYNPYDLNRDGIVADEEMDLNQEILELELREEKADSQRRMAWMAMASMVLFTVFLFLPVVSDSRVEALADLLGLFYIAQAGVVGAYMGVTAWMSKGSSGPVSRFAATTPKRVPPAAEPEL